MYQPNHLPKSLQPGNDSCRTPITKLCPKNNVSTPQSSVLTYPQSISSVRVRETGNSAVVVMKRHTLSQEY